MEAEPTLEPDAKTYGAVAVALARTEAGEELEELRGKNKEETVKIAEQMKQMINEPEKHPEKVVRSFKDLRDT